MLRTIIEKFESALDLYNSGGKKSLIEDTARWVSNNKLVFIPQFPPISIRYLSIKIFLGYRNNYLHDDSEYRIVPQPTDVVVEAGVYEGMETATYAKFGKEVIGFEPSPRNYNMATNNLSEFGNVRIVNKGLWNEKDKMEIKYGRDSGDDGFLHPDSKLDKVGRYIDVHRLEFFINEMKIDSIDFLKIEAEGAEPEVIEGMGDLRPRHIVVNAGRERDGETTGEEVISLLRSKGYNLVGVKYGTNLFFTTEEEDQIEGVIE